MLENYVDFAREDKGSSFVVTRNVTQRTVDGCKGSLGQRGIPQDILLKVPLLIMY